MRETVFPELDPELLAKVDAIKARPGRIAQLTEALSAGTVVLSERELQVLTLIAAGDLNAEIGAKLHLGTQTVMTYVKRLLVKLEARNRTHAVTCGFLTGLLPTSSEGTSCGN